MKRNIQSNKQARRAKTRPLWEQRQAAIKAENEAIARERAAIMAKHKGMVQKIVPDNVKPGSVEHLNSFSRFFGI
jgi:hypothetical protein